LNAGVDIGRWGKFYSSGWIYYDQAYELFDRETIAARSVRNEDEPLVFVEQLEQEADVYRQELRELYVDLHLGNLDIRAGKQFTIWGVLEGLRVIDEINPMDFRELILPELLDYRVPLTTLKVNYYFPETTLEAIWIPELKFHQPAAPGSEWELFQVLDTTTAPESYNWRYSELGFKVSRNILGVNLAASYFYTWDDYPTTFRIIEFSDVASPDPTQDLAILPTYVRMNMFGLSFTKDLRGDILKGEFAYVTGKYFAITDKYVDGFLVSDGEVSRDHIRWGLGYDFNFWGADISPAFAQWMILGYEQDILSKKFDSTFNVFIRKPFQRHSAVFTLLFIRLIEFEESYFKPKMTFNLTNHLQVMAGLDIFVGSRTQFGRAFSATDDGGLVDVEQRAQFLGNFRDNRRVFVEFKYNF
jgi:hypothetical protein